MSTVSRASFQVSASSDQYVVQAGDTLSANCQVARSLLVGAGGGESADSERRPDPAGEPANIPPAV